MSHIGQTELGTPTTSGATWPGRDGALVGTLGLLVLLGWILLPATGGGRWFALVLLMDAGYLTTTWRLRR